MRLDFIITEDCSLKNEILKINKNAVLFLEDFPERQDSVKKVVVTDSNFNNYQDSIQEYSYEIDNCSGLTNNSAAVVIHGLNADNKHEQHIYISEAIFSTLFVPIFSGKVFLS